MSSAQVDKMEQQREGLNRFQP